MRYTQLSYTLLIAIASLLCSSIVGAKQTTSIINLTSVANDTIKEEFAITNKKATAVKRAVKIYGKHRLIAYVVDWELPKKVNWGKLDHVAYAFAEPDAKGNLKSFSGSALKKFAIEAHKNNVGISISVGGWSGSKYFSSLIRTGNKRKKFVKNIVALVDQYKLDGVNLDWEYPNNPDGEEGNEKNPNDTANFLVFIQELRKALDAKYASVHKLITAAVGTSPFNDAKQNPISKLDRKWATLVDSYYIMNYDVSGSWNKVTGPNAPLFKGKKYGSSIVESIDAWHKAGIPNNRLVVGVPFYGRALKAAKAITASSGLAVKLASSSAIQGDAYDESSDGGYSGEFQWRSVVKQGVLKNKQGWKTYWDAVSATPYAYQAKTKKFLSFDDVKSFKKKTDYIKKQKLGGVMIWSLEMDDSSSTLLNSLQRVRSG